MTDDPTITRPGATLLSEPFRSMLALWRSLADDGAAVPLRRDLLPERLPAASLPHLLLTEFVDDRSDVVFRVIGGHVRSMCRSDWRGHRAAAVSDPAYHRDYLLPLYRAVEQGRRPIWTVNFADRKPGEPTVFVKRLLLPFGGGEGDVRYVLGVILFDRVAECPRTDRWSRPAPFDEVERLVL